MDVSDFLKVRDDARSQARAMFIRLAAEMPGKTVDPSHVWANPVSGIFSVAGWISLGDFPIERVYTAEVVDPPASSDVVESALIIHSDGTLE